MIKPFLLGIVLLISVMCQAQNRQIIVHDPVVIQAEGKYYCYSTGVGIASWQSADMVHWNFLAQVFNPLPTWYKEAVPKFDGNMWAPDISFHNGQYYLYYSISSFASNRSAIGVATNVTLDPASANYKWIDHGAVIKSVPGRDNWNAIDPNLVFDENNQPWMVFGSFWGGLKLVKLNADLLSVAEPQEWHTLASRQRDFELDETDPGNAAVEAPFITKANGYYYLFVSFDLCCRGAKSDYNVRVGRAKSILGPYLDKEGKNMAFGGGSLVIKGDENYYGIGHNSVYQFNNQFYMFSHAYDIHDDSKPKLLIHQLNWDSEGWPVITEIKPE